MQAVNAAAWGRTRNRHRAIHMSQWNRWHGRTTADTPRTLHRHITSHHITSRHARYHITAHHNNTNTALHHTYSAMRGTHMSTANARRPTAALRATLGERRQHAHNPTLPTNPNQTTRHDGRMNSHTSSQKRCQHMLSKRKSARQSRKERRSHVMAKARDRNITHAPSRGNNRA